MKREGQLSYAAGGDLRNRLGDYFAKHAEQRITVIDPKIIEELDKWAEKQPVIHRDN